MDKLILEHRGYIYEADQYEDGRYGFGRKELPDEESDSPYDFYCMADNENEARERFAMCIDGMISRKEYAKTLEEWMSMVDYKSIAAVLNILPDVFEERIIKCQFDKSLLQTVTGGDYEVPLYYVTKAWDNLLKGSLGTQAFMIGPEEDDDFSEEELRAFLKEECATRSRGEATTQNDKMKVIWKKYFDIDIDALEVDFTQYDMHLPPNVSHDEYYMYFDYVPDGVNEWIIGPINHPSEDWALHDAVSSLMEYTANIIKFERYEN